MWRAFRTLAGLLWLAGWRGTEGLIEIVEEQRCHDAEFRLTCRDLDTHIAVLEAWYTAADDYTPPNGSRTHEPILTGRDAELDRVYTYSSPKHNGVYEPTNRTFENITWAMEYSDWNDSVETVNDSVETVNISDCASFSRSYSSLNEGERARPVARNTSINLRAPVSYRCTGVNHCSFLLGQDYPRSRRWSPGVVYIKYACFDDLVSIHYCNREVSLAASGPDSEGYVRTPGYPHYYVGDRCRWRLQATEQRIRLTFLDVSLRSIGPFEKKCTDYITVTDGNGETLLSTCDQVNLPLRVTSLTDSVEISVEAQSKGAYPKRGILMHYKSVGCVPLPAPSNGYLVYRNRHVAHYMCNVNHVYVDTRQRARVIWCYDDNKWNDTIVPCVEEATAVVADNSSSVGSDTGKLPHNDGNMIVDIVIPSLLIAALFIGNAFIVLVIYKYRKRKPDDLEDEFNTIPLSANGVHSAGNAV
ncbi:uncharacterized protein LOC121727404 [Aricia agestis]|uniref:uncharacterized protein LOC121727404 n=1 Tax=Aricia agestis TaxID=91739 RepID=UPI001C207688|nr:uncharacterized protein LOC121727404 [Aricia agestis]